MLTTMHWIDWAILVGFVGFVIFSVKIATRQMKSVADFLAGGRVAGRYLLSISDNMAGLGAISIVALWEMQYQIGYGVTWWGGLAAPIMLVLTLSGWVIYRFRQTRAMTLAQFFEIRYSRSFRVYTGILAYISGVINYGIFPGVAARFFVYYCGLPLWNVSFLGFDISLTLVIVMFIILGLSLWVTLAGGQLAIMICDCMQGIACLLITSIIAIWLLHTFSWNDIYVAFQNAPNPETASMINPFKTGSIEDFNIFYFMINVFVLIYGTMAWQGQQGFNAAPKTPHEARMARVLGTWRNGTIYLVLTFLAICAFTAMHAPIARFAGLTETVSQAIAAIDSPTIQMQMTVPIILSHLLPVGLVGLLCAIVFSVAITNDDAYLHSWGSIFIQDVVMPFRKKPFAPEQHIRWLRWSIVMVAAFAFVFSIFFRLDQYIYMFFAITGAIFLGGAGSVIIGGLYWKWGTTAAAWVAMTMGSLLAVVFIVVHQFPIHEEILRIEAPPEVARVTVRGKPATRVNGAWEYALPFLKKDFWMDVDIELTTADSRQKITRQYVFDARRNQDVPGVPAGLRALAAASNRVDLAWEPADARAEKYLLERSLNKRTFDQKWAVAGEPRFTDTNVTATRIYYYRVRALNDKGLSPYSKLLPLTTPPVPPSAPAGFTAAAVRDDAIALRWTLPADAGPARKILVERSGRGYDDFQPLAELAGTATSFTDTNVKPAQIWFYRVAAVSAEGVAGRTAQVRARTQTGLPPAPLGLRAFANARQADLTWTPGASTGAVLLLQRSLNGVTFGTLARLEAQATQYADRSVKPLTRYSYRLVAQTAAGDSYPSLPAAVDTATPANFAVNVQPADGAVLTPPPGFGPRIFTLIRSTNGQILGFYGMLASIGSYILISLLQRKPFNMDLLLHRGQYAVASDQAIGTETMVTRWKSMFGVSKEFTRGDKILYFATTFWSLSWMGVFFTLLVINLLQVRSDKFWLYYFQGRFYIDLTVGLISTVWFAIGGWHDIRDVLKTLAGMTRNHADDGRVIHHHNAGEKPTDAARGK